MKGGKRKDALAQQIPIEGLEVADVEDDPVSLGNRPLIERVGPYQIEERVGVGPGLGKSRKERLTELDLTFCSEHSSIPLTGPTGLFGKMPGPAKGLRVLTVFGTGRASFAGGSLWGKFVVSNRINETYLAC